MRQTSTTERERIRLGVETLEDRVLLDGSVKVTHKGGVVELTGDARANCVEVSTHGDQLRINGCDGTRIRGGIKNNKPIKEIIVTLNEGDDSFTARDLQIAATVEIHMNEGQDDVQFIRANVDGDVSIGTGKEDDDISAERSSAKKVELDGALDNDRYDDNGHNDFGHVTCVSVEKGCD